MSGVCPETGWPCPPRLFKNGLDLPVTAFPNKRGTRDPISLTPHRCNHTTRPRRMLAFRRFGLLAHVRNQRHEASTLDGVARRALESCAVAAPLAREHLALIGAELLQQTNVLVIDIRRTGATFRSAEPAAVLPVSTKFFPRHRPGVLGRNQNPCMFGASRLAAGPISSETITIGNFESWVKPPCTDLAGDKQAEESPCFPSNLLRMAIRCLARPSRPPRPPPVRSVLGTRPRVAPRWALHLQRRWAAHRSR